MPVRRDAVAVVLLPLVLAATSGRPTMAGLRSHEPFAPLLDVIALLAWGCSGWLVVVLLLVGAGRSGSRWALLLLRRIAPPSLRGLCGLAVGAAVAVAAVPPPAMADVRPAPPVELDLDWGQRVAPPTAPVRPQPARTPAPTAVPVVVRPAAAQPLPTRNADRVLVRPGDSLWAIAARALGPRATVQQVARAWPVWWRANRGSIGDDPDLIHPGEVLVRPPSTTHDQGEA